MNKFEHKRLVTTSCDEDWAWLEHLASTSDELDWLKLPSPATRIGHEFFSTEYNTWMSIFQSLMTSPCARWMIYLYQLPSAFEQQVTESHYLDKWCASPAVRTCQRNQRMWFSLFERRLSERPSQDKMTILSQARCYALHESFLEYFESQWHAFKQSSIPWREASGHAQLISHIILHVCVIKYVCRRPTLEPEILPREILFPTSRHAESPLTTEVFLAQEFFLHRSDTTWELSSTSN